jgi:hypothetical protein
MGILILAHAHNTIIKVRCHAATHSLLTTYQKQSSNCGELARRTCSRVHMSDPVVTSRLPSIKMKGSMRQPRLNFSNDGGLPRSVQLQHYDGPDPPLRDDTASDSAPQRRRFIWPCVVVAGGAAVHGVEEVQHGLPGHRRLLRLRRRRRPCLPRRQLLAPPQDLRRRAPANGWPRLASSCPQATGTAGDPSITCEFFLRKGFSRFITRKKRTNSV